MKAVSHPLVVINCTSRKRGRADPALEVDALRAGGLNDLAREWSTRLDCAKPKRPAQQMYCGRSVTESIKAADVLRARIYFVSAGLGVVRSDDPVPAYNLTVAANNQYNVLKVSQRRDVTARDWWGALTSALGRHGKLARLIRDSKGLVILAMPSTYLHMVSDELAGLGSTGVKHVRVIGPRKPDDLPASLRTQWLPYDSRLNSLQGFAGTDTDFPHRALRHFALHIWSSSPSGCAREHAAHVAQVMADLRVEQRRSGTRLTDTELAPILFRLWRQQNGNRSRMLRELRGRLQVACEQSRFKRLVDALDGEQYATRST